MRPQSSVKVEVRGRVIGGERPLICLPLVSTDNPGLLEQAGDIERLRPDLAEWRADSYGCVEDPGAVIDMLYRLRERVGNIPLIFTCRAAAEGGSQDIPQAARANLIINVIESGMADLVDYELSNGPGSVGEIRDAAVQGGARLILSYHNFYGTPEVDALVKKLGEAQEAGADIAKAAVMPGDYRDVLNLLSATLTARTGRVSIPIITMAMGTGGIITRVAGGLFGSDISFAIGKARSAPGQIPVEVLRKAWDYLYEGVGRRETI